MSISPLSPQNQTGLVPQTLLGYSTDGVSAIEITSTAITIAGDLNTPTPIYVGISASSGLTTTLATGLDVNCDFNMNQNNITNVASIIQEGNDLYINNGSSLLDINISAGSVLNLTGDSMNLNAPSGIYANNNLIVNDIQSGGTMTITGDGLSLSSTTGTTLNTSNGTTTISSSGSNIQLTTDQDINMNNDQYTNITTGKAITITSINDKIELFSAGELNLNAPNEINITTPTDIWFNLNAPNSGDGVVYGNFFGNLTGIASSATTATTATTATLATTITTTNTNANLSHYLNFSDSSSTGNGSVQKTAGLSCNPSTNTITATTFSGLCSTGGLVYLSTGSQAITGSASATNISLTGIFNSTYKNYRIHLYPTTQVSFTAYPYYALTAFLGTGTLPTVASLYGFEITSASSALVSPVYTASATISSSPLILAVSQLINHQTIIEVENVGFTASATQSIGLKCKSIYNNPGVTGASDRTISAVNVSGSTITGLTLQQSSISVSNNMTIGWTIYGYK
jgi:hypothetical protein